MGGDVCRGRYEGLQEGMVNSERSVSAHRIQKCRTLADLLDTSGLPWKRDRDGRRGGSRDRHEEGVRAGIEVDQAGWLGGM